MNTVSQMYDNQGIEPFEVGIFILNLNVESKVMVY